jgi:hypothetical protein
MVFCFDVDTDGEQHVEMHVQIERTAKSLDQCHRTGLCVLPGEPRFWISWAEMARYTIPSNRPISCGRLANRNLSSRALSITKLIKRPTSLHALARTCRRQPDNLRNRWVYRAIWY